MDPLSVTVSVSGLILSAGKIIKSIHDLHSHLKDLPLLISSISAECTVVYASLSYLQDMQTRPRPGWATIVTDAISTSLMGCALTLSVLDKDIDACLVAGRHPWDADAVRRSRAIMSQDHLKELITQLRGQQMALSLLLTTLQRSVYVDFMIPGSVDRYGSETVSKIKSTVNDNHDLLQRIAKRAKVLWQESERSSSLRKSIGSTSNPASEISSVVTTTHFDFDSEIVQSAAYQRATNHRRAIKKRQPHLASQNVVDGNDTATVTLERANGSKNVSDANSSPLLIPLFSPHESPKAANATGGRESSKTTMVEFGSETVKVHDATKTDGLSVVMDPDTATTFQHPDYDSPHWPLPSVGISGFRRDSYAEETVEQKLEVIATATTIPNLTLSPNSTRQELTYNKTQPFDNFVARFNYYASRSNFYDSVPKKRKVVFVGDSCCGLTAVIWRFLRKEFYPVYQPTVFENYDAVTVIGGRIVELDIQDTPGQEDYDRLRPLVYPDGHVIVIGFAIDDPNSLYNVIEKVSWYLSLIVLALSSLIRICTSG